MKLRNKNALLFVLTIALMVVSAGCPNSNTITSGIGTTQLTVVVTNPNRFEVGTFSIDRIMVRPVDARADSALGSARDIKLSQSPIFVDASLGMVDPAFIRPATLSQGVYEVVEIRMSSLLFVDADLDIDPATCESWQFFYATGSSNSSERITITFPNPPQFTVVDGQESAFNFSFDLTAMISTLNNALTCSTGCGAFCATNFDPDQFAADTLNYLTID
jgi:hypothetical protein